MCNDVNLRAARYSFSGTQGSGKIINQELWEQFDQMSARVGGKNMKIDCEVSEAHWRLDVRHQCVRVATAFQNSFRLA